MLAGNAQNYIQLDYVNDIQTNVGFSRLAYKNNNSL